MVLEPSNKHAYYLPRIRDSRLPQFPSSLGIVPSIELKPGNKKTRVSQNRYVTANSLANHAPTLTQE